MKNRPARGFSTASEDGWRRVVDLFANNIILLPEWDFAHTALPKNGCLQPFFALPGVLDEPLISVATGAARHVISNVCSHRAHLLLNDPEVASDRLGRLVCPYHGRRFDLNGKCLGQPYAVADLSGDEHGLARRSLKEFFGFKAFSVNGPDAEALLVDEVQWWDHIGHLPHESLKYAATESRDYDVPGDWWVYIENYLDGLHIPFIHPGLLAEIDMKDYRTITFERSVLQLGYGKPASDCFDLPESHPAYLKGRGLKAFYFFLFPNLMFNYYPWGLSLNIVLPQKHGRSKVCFRSFVWDEGKRHIGAGSKLGEVELEDEAAIASVQSGLKSRLYKPHSLVPGWEAGVGLFQELLQQNLSVSS